MHLPSLGEWPPSNEKNSPPPQGDFHHLISQEGQVRFLAMALWVSCLTSQVQVVVLVLRAGRDGMLILCPLLACPSVVTTLSLAIWL